MSVELEYNTDHSYSNDDDHIDSLIQNDKIDSLAKNSSKSDDSNTNRLDLQTNNSLDSDNKD